MRNNCLVMLWKTNPFIIFFGLAPCVFLIAEETNKNNLIKPGLKIDMPEELFKAYAAFVRDTKKPSKRGLLSHCLPNAVEVTSDARAEDFREYGKDINIPFLVRGFNSQLIGIKKMNEDVYQLGTLSSGLWFVRTKTLGWKIYLYDDSPQD